MKTIKILYWVFTALFAAFMIFSATGNIMVDKQSVMFLADYLKYPVYFIPFIGWAKLLGSIAILIPGFPRIKEWAYAGLFFDLTGAAYSLLAMQTPISQVAGMLLPIGLGAVSYWLYHKKLKQSQAH
ncbi:MAG: DoxX family protein [Bacteroidota bacterium]|jgi:uncharacterized membrane protein YphA (DoxX/SURF4 family)